MSRLRESARKAPHCFLCWKPNPNGNLLCLAHSNAQTDGKGMALKSHDEAGAILCQACHDAVDGRGSYWMTGESRKAMHREAHLRTVEWWKENKYL